MTDPIFVPRKAAEGKAAAERESLYVQVGDLARTAPLIPGVPTIAIELGTDMGPTAMGLLRRVEMSGDGRIVGVYLETQDNLCNVVLQSGHGFRIMQGAYAEKEYLRHIKQLRQIITETDEEAAARRVESTMPRGLARALADASGGRVFGVQVEVDDDEDEELLPDGSRNTLQH